MSTTANKKPVIWTLENTAADPPPSAVSPPFRGANLPDERGTFRIREPETTIDAGWDLVGQWEVDPHHGLVILSIGLEPSTYVTDGCPPERTRLRRGDGSEWPRAGIKFKDLGAIRLSRVREEIREHLRESRAGGFFHVPVGQEVAPIVQRQLDVIDDAVAAQPKTGRPRTTEVELDQWAREVIDCLSGREGSLYSRLAERWVVSESTVKNHRLGQLRDTGRLAGKGSQLLKGPNYPVDEEVDDG